MWWALPCRNLNINSPLLIKLIDSTTRSKTTAVTLSYKILGNAPLNTEAPPVLMFHGLLGHKKHLDSIGKTILNLTKRAVITVDLRNHGDSPWDKRHSYEALAKDVVKLYEKMNINSASLIGHSMGGLTAMCVALLHPEKVSSIIVIDISPISTPVYLTTELPEVLAMMNTIDFKGQKNVENAKNMVKTKLRPLIEDDLLLRAILSNVKLNRSHEISWACNIDVLIKEFQHIIRIPESLKKRKYNGPVLFIGGQKSDFLPPDDLTGIKDIFPQAIIKYIPNTGHNLHAEDPKSFLEYAIAFLKL